MASITSADNRSQSNERGLEELTNSITESQMWLAAYTYERTTLIEVLLKRQGTTLEYSEVYLPNPLANIKQINHSVMAMVLNKIQDRPLHLFYSLKDLDKNNIAIKDGVNYTAIPLEDNPVQKRLKNRVREAQ